MLRPQSRCCLRVSSEVATISLAWDETTSSTRKAGRGWDCQLGLLATSVAGKGARSGNRPCMCKRSGGGRFSPSLLLCRRCL